MPVLPFTLLRDGEFRSARGRRGMNSLDGIGCGMHCMGGNMRSCRSMSGSAGCSASLCRTGVTGRRMSGKRSLAGCGHLKLTAHPGASCFNRLPRPLVFRACCLQIRQHAFGAVGSPER
jgi:hypothetical protein